MAMIKCSECGREVSDKATSCVHCGCPISKTPKKMTRKEEKERVAQLKRDKTPFCPKCYSTNIQAQKKGFGLGKAIIGTVVTGGLYGAVAGGIGAKKMQRYCLNCGHKWKG